MTVAELVENLKNVPDQDVREVVVMSSIKLPEGAVVMRVVEAYPMRGNDLQEVHVLEIDRRSVDTIYGDGQGPFIKEALRLWGYRHWNTVVRALPGPGAEVTIQLARKKKGCEEYIRRGVAEGLVCKFEYSYPETGK